MIRFDDVVVRYPRSSDDALSGVSLEAKRGALTAVVGPNGSGKSTLIRALIGRIGRTRGSIHVDGTSIDAIPRDELARRVAVVTQREDLAFPALVSDYVALGRFPHLGIWHAAEERDRRAIEAAIVSAGVEALRDRRVDAISGGEWQRVRLARALAQGGDALVLDEPTAYQLNLVARFADHLVLLHRGRVAATGSPDEVMRPEVLEPVYEWPLVVTRDPAVGAPALVPKRQIRQ